MTDRELEQRLQGALNHAAPDDLADVFARCEAGKGTVIDMKNATSKNKKRRMGLIAACLALVLIAGGGGGFFYHEAHAVASVISLDVNPSIELTVNKNEKVLSCTGLNTDGASVLADMGGGRDLVGAKLDVAVNAIVGALVRGGYLDNLDSAILISVEDNDTTRGERIQRELTASVGGTLEGAANQAAVLTQTMTVDAGLDAQARQSSISTGKAYLVGQVLAMNGNLDFDALAALSVEELRDMIQTGATAMPIGRDAAIQAVLAYAGLDETGYSAADVDPELDERTPYYDVELMINGREYEYGVDAYTGEVYASGSAAAQAVTPSASGEPAAAPGAAAVQPQSDDIGTDAAKAAALAKAGLTEDQVSRLKAQRDYDDGRLEYEVEFRSSGCEYEYTIDGSTGAVLEYDRDWDD